MNTRILIIKLDGIGDYILSRNFLTEVKATYPNSQISLLCNWTSRELATHFDSKIFDTFRFLRIDKFQKNRAYRFLFRNRVRRWRYDLVICPTFSRRKYIEEDIAGLISSKKKIAPKDDNFNSLEEGTEFSTQISTYGSGKFEYLRYKDFYEQFLERKLSNHTRPELRIGVDKAYEKTVVVSLGAGDKKRQWNAMNYAFICAQILETYGYKILLCGSANETKLGQYILREVGSERISNMCSHYSYIQFIKAISNAHFFIGNESSGSHCANALRTQGVCVSNGNHIGRFHPYPKELQPTIKYLYPKNIDIQDETDFEKLNFGSDLDVNLISKSEVWEVVRDSLEAIK